MARVQSVLAGGSLKVAVVCPYAWDRSGGVQSHVRSLAHFLRKRAHEVAVIAPHAARHPSPPEEDVSLIGHAVSVTANGSVAPLAFGPLAAAGVRRALRAFDPDVVHLHEPLIPSLPLMALWNTHRPTVGTFHAAANSSMGYLLGRPVLERAARRLDVRTAVSDAARDLIARYFPARYLLTPNGVDTERFSTAPPLDLPGGPKRVLFLSRIERRKGLEVLIQALTRLRDIDVELLVAGTGPEERSCRALAERLQVRARWLGHVSEADVARAYRSADVYSAPGLGRESFGIVLVEAMAAGIPVVCSDLPGFRGVAEGAATLVPAGEAGALSDALRAVLTDEPKAAAMRVMSARIAGGFDWSRLVPGVEKAYEAAAASTSGAIAPRRLE
jgi:phosphatidyl-myo-inositol alpha-mannosyltransferase